MMENHIYKKIEVLQELKDFIRPLTAEERSSLEQNILANGVQDAVILWEKPSADWEKGNDNVHYIIIDGHNRYEVCQKHAIKFPFSLMHFADIDAVKLFMAERQLGKRNLTPAEQSYYRGLEYRNAKKQHGGSRGEEASSQNDNLKTSEILAKKYNTSAATINRDARYSQALDIIGTYNVAFRNDILTGKAKIEKEFLYELVEFAKVRDESIVKDVIETALRNLSAGIKPHKIAAPKPKAVESRQQYENKIFAATSKAEPKEQPKDPEQENIHKLKFELAFFKNKLENQRDYDNLKMEVAFWKEKHSEVFDEKVKFMKELEIAKSQNQKHTLRINGGLVIEYACDKEVHEEIKGLLMDKNIKEKHVSELFEEIQKLKNQLELKAIQTNNQQSTTNN